MHWKVWSGNGNCRKGAAAGSLRPGISLRRAPPRRSRWRRRRRRALRRSCRSCFKILQKALKEVVVASHMVSPPAIPGSGKDGARTWVHNDFRCSEFKTQLNSGADGVREVVRSMLQKVLEEELGMGTFVAQREWLAEVNACWPAPLKSCSEDWKMHSSE